MNTKNKKQAYYWIAVKHDGTEEDSDVMPDHKDMSIKYLIRVPDDERIPEKFYIHSQKETDVGWVATTEHRAQNPEQYMVHFKTPTY